jgi:hypothetical protein
MFGGPLDSRNALADRADTGQARNLEAWAIDLSPYAGPRDVAMICKQVGR